MGRQLYLCAAIIALLAPSCAREPTKSSDSPGEVPGPLSASEPTAAAATVGTPGGSAGVVIGPELSGLERDVLKEVNFARQHPQEYAATLRGIARHVDGKLLRLPGQTALLTQEGHVAFAEAIAVMERQTRLGPIRSQIGLHRAAEDHVKDIGPRGLTQHEGSDGSVPRDRIERYVKWHGHAGENLGFGPDTGKAVVWQLMVDDGVPGRGHRNNILKPTFALAGIACGAHAKYRTMCVIDFVDGVTE